MTLLEITMPIGCRSLCLFDGATAGNRSVIEGPHAGGATTEPVVHGHELVNHPKLEPAERLWEGLSAQEPESIQHFRENVMSKPNYLTRLLAALLCCASIAASISGSVHAAPPPAETAQAIPRGANVSTDALLLTEITVAAEGAEFIEIHNRSAATVDLSDVYLSDATFAPNGVFYYNIVTGDRNATGGGRGFGDFSARFPAGATIAAGDYQVISLAGSDAFQAAWGFLPDYELYEDGASVDGIPDMREALPDSINDQGDLTDSGEFAVLFFWDGSSDLVQDLDYTVWGDQAEAVDKTGISIDGPDGDSTASAYLADTPIASQQVLGTGGPSDGLSFQRDDLNEGTELQTGGNGIAGSDETSENISETWCIAEATPGAASNCPKPLPPLACGQPATRIHAVQGDGAISPLVGDLVEIEAVVVADFAEGVSGELGGFFVQEEDADADADPLTSEGVFVLSTMLDVEPGDLVRARGRVEESFGATRISNVDAVINCGTGFSVTPVPLTLPIVDSTVLESAEGMAVTLPQALSVTDVRDLARFGEFTLSNGRLIEPTQTVMPGAAALAQQQANDQNRLLVDDGRLGTYASPFPVGGDDATPLDADNPIRTGYTVTGLRGAMHFTFNNYKIEPTAPIVFDQTAQPRTSAPDLTDAPLRVAALNVLNFFSTLDDAGPVCAPAMNRACRGADTAGELTRQTDKIVPAILALNADIVALSEIENNATASLQALVDALDAATAAGTWAFVDAGPIGSDAIKNGLIYTPATVDLVGAPAVLDSSVDGRFDSSLNRPALAQTFDHITTGERLTVSANHLKSKGCGGASGADADQGDGQGCYNAARTSAAEALLDWMGSDPTGADDPDYLILGDLNSYPMEDPIQVLIDAGLDNLGTRYDDPAQAYSFQFFGEFGALDYVLASPSLALQVLDATHWHINADELAEFDYNEEDLSAGRPKPANFYAADPYRSSDHDPVIAAIVPGSGIVDGGSEQTRLEADRQFAAADGADAATITVQLVNRAGQPASGVAVQLAVTGSGVLAQASGITEASGRFTTMLTNSVVEEVLVTATYDANGSGTAEAPIVNGAPRSVTFQNPLEGVFADGFE